MYLITTDVDFCLFCHGAYLSGLSCPIQEATYLSFSVPGTRQALHFAVHMESHLDRGAQDCGEAAQPCTLASRSLLGQGLARHWTLASPCSTPGRLTCLCHFCFPSSHCHQVRCQVSGSARGCPALTVKNRGTSLPHPQSQGSFLFLYCRAV